MRPGRVGRCARGEGSPYSNLNSAGVRGATPSFAVGLALFMTTASALDTADGAVGSRRSIWRDKRWPRRQAMA